MSERRRQCRQYTPEFRIEAVRVVRETGRPIPEVARELKVHRGTLANWVHAWQWTHSDHEQSPTPVVRAQLEKPRDEVRTLRIDIEFW